VQTVSLTWEHSLELGAVLAAAGGALALPRRPRVRQAGALLRETAVIAVLYGLWQLAGRVSLHDTGDAYARARWIEHFQSDLWLPSEPTMQHMILGHPLIVQAANLYYATMHFTMMFVFLLWLFVRHRDQYRPVRTTMAMATGVCLLIQLIPVAPPRMLPGFVDTAMLYNQSVYSNGFAADQLSAMPSVHVAWAVVVGYYAVKISTSRWRWIAVVHTALTVFCVVATANHWWLDGIVATTVLAACAWLRYGLARAWHAVVRRRREPEQVPADALVPEPA
jgi:hypothetical protein